MTINSEFLFWIAWIVVPLIVEIIPSIGNFLLLSKKFLKTKFLKTITYYPEITIIIPVYNSADTLKKCIKSINDSTYNSELITIILVDNGSKDRSFEIFKECQKEFTDLNMYYILSNQGKSRALNKAIFNSRGKYIINVDSDGRFNKFAIENIVKKFERNIDSYCLTGVILTEAQEIDETKNFFLRQIRKLEFIEYCNAFLAGRNYHSEKNSLFTISGAFSAFRKSALLQSFLYNTDTICEDAHMTFQMRKNNKKIELCEDAIFYVSPIDNMGKLYTQRQRWQIGELEVFNMFYKKRLTILKIFKDPALRTLIFDHTFSFPKLIWYFALIALLIYNYSLKTIFIASIIIYFLYVLVGFLTYINVNMFLSKFKEDKKYYRRKILYLFIFPLYNAFTFILRLIGIVNCTVRGSSWKTYSFKEEMSMVKDIILKDIGVKKEENTYEEYIEPWKNSNK